MNRNLYRLVFNAACGMPVAVQECATGRAKGRHGSVGSNGGNTAFAPVLWRAALATAMMGLPAVLDQAAHAQTLPIQVDRNAPGQRPVVGVAANGVPVVNIAPPQRNGGTSVNNFIQYGVGPSGVVLNNSGQNSQTQIAGWVQGNMQLGNNSASNIVLQVMQPNPSQLMGQQEIAGRRANLLLANPAGITCSGCGVINADRFTLSTGRPVFGADGDVTGFDVRAGNIAIGGQGLSSPQAQVDLLARSISINAELWARHLNAITGANQIDHATLNTTPQAVTGAAPQLALDAAALGSMYANSVRLIGTEKGVGFNIGGGISARAGDIVVDNNGDVRIAPGGRLQADGSATVAGANIDNAGTITTRGAIATTTPGQLTNSGVLAAGTDLTGQADSIVNSGTIGAGVDANANGTGAGTANLTAGTAIRSNGSILTGADINLSAPTLDLSNGKVTSHDTARLSASGDITHRNARLEANTVQISAAGTVDNRGAAIVAGVNGGTVRGTSVLNQRGTISSGGALGVEGTQTVDNTGGAVAGTLATTVAAPGVVNRSGVIGSVQDKLTVTGALDNTSGKALAATDLRVTGGAIVNDHGQMSAGETLNADTAGQALTNTAGVIAAANIQADTGRFDNRAGVVQSTGLLVADTHGQRYDNSQGLTVANGDLTLSTGAFGNQAGTVSGKQSVTVNMTTFGNAGGKVVSGGPLAMTGDSLSNNGGQLASNGDARFRIAGTFDNTAGFTHAGGTLGVQAGTLVNRDTLGGTEKTPRGMEGASVKLTANAIDNGQGALRADAVLDADAATLDNSRGEVTSGGTAQLNVGTTTNTDGLLAANTSLGIQGNTLTGDGTVQSQGDLSARLTGDFNNTKTVAAGKTLSLDTSGDVASSGKMTAGEALDVHGRNVSNSGELVGQVSNTIRADQAVTNSGLIDGGAVRVQAGTTVTNTERIFGDTVAIGAGVLILNDRNAATGKGGVIASRTGDVDLGAPDIVNREHALILSSQDLRVGGALDADGKATGQASSLTNASAVIDVARDADIKAASIRNESSHFETQVTDTGVQRTLVYRLKGSLEDIDPATALIFDWSGKDDYFHAGTDLGWLYRDGNQKGVARLLLLPSEQYPFAEFGPPFDWSRRPDGEAGPVMYWQDPFYVDYYGGMPKNTWSPVGLAYTLHFENDVNGNPVLMAEKYNYPPDHPIWDKLKVARPDSAPPPYPAACEVNAPPACIAAHQKYRDWHDANIARYEALNDKIIAFNKDFHARTVDNFYSVDKQTQVREEVVLHTDPARLLVGGNATLNGAVVNDKSEIAIGGTLNVPAPVRNEGYTGTRFETVTGTQAWHYINHGVNAPDRRSTTAEIPPLDVTLPLQLATGTTQQNLQTVPGSGTAIDPRAGVTPIASAPTLTQVALNPGGATAGGRLGGEVIRTVTPSLAMPTNALFVTRTDPGARYLIETDSRFTNQRQWLSSDFMLTQLGQDPTRVLKRLGDGFYEARLVADAVMLGTGQRFVGDYTGNEAQYQALMQSGVEFARQFSLNVGTALTAEQMRALTTDIVWMVEKTVTLPDGSTQQVLVPQVYLKVRAGDLKGDGTLITARNAKVRTDGDVKNTGTIAARDVMLIDAGNIRNERGTLSAGAMGLNAKQDLDNLAGRISADNLAVTAGRDINLTTTTASAGNRVGESTASRTVISGVASVEADNAVFVAGRDINSQAASIAAADSLGMGAERDINLDTVQVAEGFDAVADAKNRSSVVHTAEIGTLITGRDITLAAGQDVNAKAAYVSADDAIAVSAGRDINVTAGEAGVAIRDEQSMQSGGFLSKKSTHTIDAASRTEALGSTFSGDTVDMAAGRDLTTSGSTIAATHDVNLDARRDITIGTAETTSSSYSFKEEKKSGFGATGSGLSYGKREQKDTVNDKGMQQAGSLIGSTDGSVHMKAGSTLKVTGSDLIARQDITGVAADVTIEAAQNSQHHDETHEVRQSGFTLGVSGGAIGAAINAGNKVSSASKSQDGRASALWGIAAARDVADTGAALAQAGGDPLKGAAVTLSFGTSQSKRTLTEDSISHNGANVSAGGTAAFMATGVNANGNKTAGNLNVIGSNIDANKVALGAKHDINIMSATDMNESHRTNKSSSASVGVSYGAQGFGVSASASKSKGNADSGGTSQANSHVTGRESVTFVSGNDTNILGAMVGGGKVVGDVGGNLNIASRQDTEEMRARQQSIGGGFSISQGGGSASFSASKGKASGNYANVSEQSGIHAGDGGFDIRVEGNTDLKGAVIASVAGKDKNHLDTGTLSFSDMQNHSDYSATSFGVSGGITAGPQNGEKNSGQTSGRNTGGISPMVPQHESGSQDGVARSAIADGTITIRDEASQKQDLADLRRDTVGTNTTVGKNPDLMNVLDKQADMMAAAQAAGEAVAKTVGQVANAKQEEAQNRYKTAAQAYQQDPSAENQAAMTAAQSDIDGWKEGGDYRAALHGAGGALVAGLGGGNALAGAAGAAGASLSAPKIQNGVNAVYTNVNTGNTDLDHAIANIAGNIAAGGIGAVIGGGSGASTASNVDRFNRQLTYAKSEDMKTVAAKEAAKAGMTPEQMEKAMGVVLGTYYDEKGVAKSEGVTYDQYMKAQAALLSQPANSPLAKEYAQSQRGVLPQFAFGDADGAPNFGRVPLFGIPTMGAIDDAVASQAAIRARVEGNVAESAAARAGSNFNKLNEWPPNNGFVPGTGERYTLFPGQFVDRYGSVQGTFVAEAGASYRSRALRPGSDSAPYHVYEVTRPIEVTAGPTRPWFGYEGMGTQYKFDESVRNLINRGALRRTQ
ncbi:Filamentous hemagglutinin / adhesin [Cupriavidus necator]|uniref:two-partner secretion domain-containing protein n=1 Tax=Cupriavidus necator TaxID=106590 RepID=UPI0005A0B13A|nr:hemagglutinin repeat-containing protein [Cupriavidus necator]QQB80038.1 hemagglutinin repeat-containing protein [Cupriavidus necator]WKA44293.1 hemagglutinin repeat-containing protein [Cupriavidus necator]